MAPITAVPLPATSAITHIFPRVDYADAYRCQLPREQHDDIDTLTRDVFLARPPAWLAILLFTRDQLVRPFGIKTLSATSPHTQPKRLEPGSSLGFFKVFQRSTDEIMLGEDDRHLDYRVSVLRTEEQAAQWLTVSTVVRFHNWLGRLYFLPVRPIHHRIVPWMLRNAARRMEHRQSTCAFADQGNARH